MPLKMMQWHCKAFLILRHSFNKQCNLFMPEIKPFSGVLYHPELLKQAEKLICPPYDIISSAQQQSLYHRSPLNAIRLELPLEENPYGTAAARLTEWLQSGELQHDSEPAIYPYFQTFEDLEGKSHVRHGFFTAMRLHEFSENKVLRHEKTLSAPKADRLNLFRATRTNISPIYGLYADEHRTLDQLMVAYSETHEPLLDANVQGIRNRLWRITDPTLLEQFRQTLLNRQVYIADGHHRYDTGVTYRNERMAANPTHNGNEPYNFIFTCLTNIYDEGLIVFPLHRVLHSVADFNAERLKGQLAEFFTITDLNSQDELKAYLAASTSSFSYGVVTSGALYGMTLKGEAAPLLDAQCAHCPEAVAQLGVVVLHEVIFHKLLGISHEALEAQRNLLYVTDVNEVFHAVACRTAQAGFVVKPTTVQQVLDVSESGEVMPQKSTFFYPKLMTGLLFNPLD